MNQKLKEAGIWLLKKIADHWIGTLIGLLPSAVVGLSILKYGLQETLSFLPARDREWIFSGTAQTLYPALLEK